MDARSENAGLDSDFVSECDGATIGHVGAEPAPLEEDDLIAARDGDGAVDEVEPEEDESGEGGVADDEVEQRFHGLGRDWLGGGNLGGARGFACRSVCLFGFQLLCCGWRCH